MAKNTNKYWLLIPPIAIFGFLWWTYGHIAVLCICPWNDWGTTISSITALVILAANLYLTHTWIKTKNRKLYFNYIAALVIGITIFVAVIRTGMYFLT
jgi:hypothetical protein